MSPERLILPHQISLFSFISLFPPAFGILSPLAVTALTKPAQKFDIPTRPAVA
jgi:hypothetical protein